MHLRSGKSIASGASSTSRASTQGSGTQVQRPLSAIREDISSLSTEISSEAFVSMEDFINLHATTSSQPLDIDLPKCSDPLNRLAMKIEDIPSTTEAKVWVTTQGDQYMSLIGIKYLLMPKFEHMDATGHQHPPPNIRAFSKPIFGMSACSGGRDSPSMAFTPSTPPQMEPDWGTRKRKRRGESCTSFASRNRIMSYACVKKFHMDNDICSFVR